MSNQLSAYAVNDTQSRNRRSPEKPHPYRCGFERDRDRIMHCSAFRRLEGKTQVFMPGLDDHYRTRLTHSIEVAQIGRTIAKALNLNESLTEAICLGHDLGHSPFGHAGEYALNELMARFGGFEHNRQALRIVDLLEHPYPDFAGLNLMYETRLGFAMHHSPYDKPQDSAFTESNCSLEGQIADLADRIAYNCHDLEDGLRAELIGEQQLEEVKLFADAQANINAKTIAEESTRQTRTAKSIIDILVSDLLKAGTGAIAEANIKTIDDVYNCPHSLIILSTGAETDLVRLEKFLLENMYEHHSFQETAAKVKMWLESLFEKFCNNPDLMPEYYQGLVPTEGLERIVCDYIAGMTDRFCLSMLDEI